MSCLFRHLIPRLSYPFFDSPFHVALAHLPPPPPSSSLIELALFIGTISAHLSISHLHSFILRVKDFVASRGLSSGVSVVQRMNYVLFALLMVDAKRTMDHTWGIKIFATISSKELMRVIQRVSGIVLSMTMVCRFITIALECRRTIESALFRGSKNN